MPGKLSVFVHCVRCLSYHCKTNDGQENMSHVSFRPGAAVNRAVRSGTVGDDVRYNRKTAALFERSVRAKTPAGDEWQGDRTNDLSVWEVILSIPQSEKVRKFGDASGISDGVFCIGRFFCV